MTTYILSIFCVGTCLDGSSHPRGSCAVCPSEEATCRTVYLSFQCAAFDLAAHSRIQEELGKDPYQHPPPGLNVLAYVADLAVTATKHFGNAASSREATACQWRLQV